MVRRVAVPVPSTPFVGRRGDLAAIAELIAGGARSITLTGAPGVGKTRLAIEVARRCVDEFGDAVYFVGLDEIREPDRVPPAMLSALGVPDTGSGDPLGSLVELLGTHRCLMVLDNFEQVVSAGRAVATLIDRCPDLTVLVTSRQPLRIAAERGYPVTPLAVPDESGADVVEPADDAAGFLLSRLAAQVARGTADVDRSVVIDICRHVDGLPLALELVAARARTLPLPMIRDALDRRLEVLTRGDQDLPDRQRTMRDAIAWSHELLPAPAKLVLRRMGACVGGVSRTSLSALTDDLALTRVELLDAVDDLVAHGLVERVSDDRFRLLEVVREFALEQLTAAGDLEAALARHGEHFLARAEQASAHFSGPDQAAWLDRLDDDAANLMAAVTTAIERGDVGRALRLCLALRFFWYVRGPLIRGQALFAAALSLPGGSERLRMQALVDAAALARHRGHLRAAEGLAGEALTLARELADPDAIATALLQLGFVRHLGREYRTARASLSESLDLREAAGDRLGAARALHHLGLAAYYGDGDLEQAWQLQARCLVLFRELANHRHTSTVLIAMAELARARGEPGRARELLDDALDSVTRLHDLPSLAYALRIAAAVAADSTRPSLAVRMLGAAEGVEARCGAAPWPAVRAGEQRWLSAAVARLGRPRVAHLRAAGSALTDVEATALARAVEDRAPNTPLTPRELEVAEHVAAGLTNRAIAARLVLSDRTVDGHVAHIMTKLGFGSRAQIAAWVAGRRDHATPDSR